MRVVFIGTGDIGLPVLRWLREAQEHELAGVVTQPDKPAGRDQRLTPPPIRAALPDSAIPVLQPVRIKADEAIAAIRALAPDVIIVMAYGQILPRALLEIPKVACLNLHASLLPRWRGAAPIQAAIAAGDGETGITVMYMSEGLDTGDILMERRIAIASGETGGSLHDKLAELAPVALADAISLLASKTAPRIPQDDALATSAPKLEREHGKIDWNDPADVIERKIRAFNPWPGAFSNIMGSRLKIFSATMVDLSGQPGEVLRRDGEIIVAARARAVSLGEVQPEGKRRMSAAEFARGHRP